MRRRSLALRRVRREPAFRRRRSEPVFAGRDGARALPANTRAPSVLGAQPQTFARGREVAALLLWTFAVFLALALASYAGEPLARGQVEVHADHGENWVGPVGAVVARGSCRSSASLSWVVPLEALLLGIPFVRGRKSNATPARLAGDILIVVIGAALVQVGWPGEGRVRSVTPAGGMIGELFGEIARSLFSTRRLVPRRLRARRPHPDRSRELLVHRADACPRAHRRVPSYARASGAAQSVADAWREGARARTRGEGGARKDERAAHRAPPSGRSDDPRDDDDDDPRQSATATEIAGAAAPRRSRACAIVDRALPRGEPARHRREDRSSDAKKRERRSERERRRRSRDAGARKAAERSPRRSRPRRCDAKQPPEEETPKKQRCEVASTRRSTATTNEDEERRGRRRERRGRRGRQPPLEGIEASAPEEAARAKKPADRRDHDRRHVRCAREGRAHQPTRRTRTKKGPKKAARPSSCRRSTCSSRRRRTSARCSTRRSSARTPSCS